ncbi:hypothetical protein OKW39_008238 [Paraburkholderia sp. MM6662-R1]
MCRRTSILAFSDYSRRFNRQGFRREKYVAEGRWCKPGIQVAARDKNDCQRKMQRPCLSVEMQGVRLKIAEASLQYGQQPGNQKENSNNKQ